jgi:hypothetical protein
MFVEHRNPDAFAVSSLITSEPRKNFLGTESALGIQCEIRSLCTSFVGYNFLSDKYLGSYSRDAQGTMQRFLRRVIVYVVT